MDRSTFLKEQFVTIRREIEETKARIFKTLAFGIAVVPAAHYLAKVYELDIVLYATPLLVIVVALLYLSENHALMRCGRYILREIEPHLEGVVGWETWLEARGSFDPRTVDKLLSVCFYLLYFVYFSGSAFLATRKALAQLGEVTSAALLGAYVAIGIWFLIYLFRNIRTSTRTAIDDDRPGR